MLVRRSLKHEAAADAMENAVNQVLKTGMRTADIAQNAEPVVNTSEMGTAIAEAISDAD